ncbi:MAG: hypothetical protein D3906_04540 [Candidatus Electrothrix sp. AUS1_2]|nr:hypothetical protein [Candidatus Electrothrix sp. AUS1_2]
MVASLAEQDGSSGKSGCAGRKSGAAVLLSDFAPALNGFSLLLGHFAGRGMTFLCSSVVFPGC